MKIRLFAAVFLLACSLCAPIAARAQSVIHLEAESGTLSGGVTTASSNGVGYVTGFTAGHGLITFSGVSATPGPYEVLVRYRAASGSESCSVTANGFALSATFPVSSNFYIAAAGAVTLASTNTLTIGGGSGGYDIDYIELRPIVSAEAESGTLSGSASVQSYSGASGGQVVSVAAAEVNNVQSGTTMTVNAAAGLYDLQVAYISPYGYKAANVSVDNGAVASSVGLTSTTLSTADAGKYLLSASGSHTVFIGGNYGYYLLDKIMLVPAGPDAAPLPVSSTPVDPAATPHAQALLSYLNSLYGGSQMVSGQHNLPEFPYVEDNTSQQPAILGVDLIDYSPSRVLFSAMPGASGGGYASVEPAIAQEAADNNILAVMWHWNAPDELINSSSEEWYSGFYTAATTYNVQTALANPNSNDYKLLIADMDTVALQLQKFQQAGIPVLWRPLHEASGEFFWWGAQGSGPFIQLWKLMYNRFTGPLWNLHNLIWVFGGSDPSWYPGDSYVDIVGADIYDSDVPTFEKDPTDTTWETYKQAFDGDKMIAATEVGGAPDAAMMHQYGVDWLYFMSWPGFEEQVPTAQLSALYNSSSYLNGSSLPAWPWNSSSQLLTKATVSGTQNTSNNGWFAGAATVTLARSSNAVATYYTVDGGAQQTYTQPFTVTGEGLHPVVFWSKDGSGHIEDPKTRTLLIDSTPPASLCTAVVVSSSGYQVTLNASDATSGAQAIYYQVDGGSTVITTTFTTPIAVSGSGNHTLKFWSSDIAGNVEVAHTLALNANSGLTPSLALNPASVTGGQTSTATVTLSAAAPAGGLSVALASSNTAVAAVPSSVQMAAGTTTATFKITTGMVQSSAQITISATISVTSTATLTVVPAAVSSALASVSLNPSSVIGGQQNSTGTVTLTSASPTGGATVSLASGNTTAAIVPSSVAVPAGATSATFPITSLKVMATSAVAITASYGGASKAATLTVTPSTAAATRFDFNRDGHSDLVWYNTGTGGVSVWDMDDQSVLSYGATFTQLAPSSGWVPVATPDINADGYPDLLWWNKNTGELSFWTLSNTTVLHYYGDFATVADTDWKPVAAADVTGTTWELVFQNTATGALSAWDMNGQTVTSYGPTLATLGANTPYQVVGAPDLDGDGKSDLLFWDSQTGGVSYWSCNLAASQVLSYHSDFTSLSDTSWHLVGSEDTNGDGHSDLLWWNAGTGEVSRWLLNGTTVTNYGGDSGKVPDTTWQPTAMR